MKFVIATVIIVAVFSASRAFGQEEEADYSPEEEAEHLPSETDSALRVLVGGIPEHSPSQSDATEIDQRWHTSMEIGLSIGVLVFGLLLIKLQVNYLKSGGEFQPMWALKMTGITLVVTAGLFLIVAGFSQTQTAPMMGLLGTVAGYLLGKEAK